jgi:hypothetical protein
VAFKFCSLIIFVDQQNPSIYPKRGGKRMQKSRLKTTTYEKTTTYDKLCAQKEVLLQKIAAADETGRTEDRARAVLDLSRTEKGMERIRLLVV